MILLKRVLTSMALFVFLFVALYLGICIVGGAISGGIAGANHPQDSFELGRRAGENFVRNNLLVIVLSAFGISLVSSLSLSFSGIIPWCRKSPQPPKISSAPQLVSQ
jgi:hypothetical protein